MQKFLEYNQIVRKPIVPQIGRVLLLLITETQYAQNNQEFCTGTRPVPPSKEDMSNTQEEHSSSEHEADPEVSFHSHQPPQLSTSQVRQPQPAAGMYMTYIEGPCMDWTVNDGLYHRFLKWCLKCENILECQLVALQNVNSAKR